MYTGAFTSTCTAVSATELDNTTRLTCTEVARSRVFHGRVQSLVAAILCGVGGTCGVSFCWLTACVISMRRVGAQWRSPQRLGLIHI